jgi:hypothetical protein
MRFIDRGDNRAAGGGPAVLPSVVGEDTPEFVRTDAGWRFAWRTFEVLFG